jgi:predicted NAD-dependent protein-ADP-ribosyltransferase YbiA (DUF1768 family)
MQGKKDAYAEHHYRCDGHHYHSDSFYQHAEFYYYQYDHAITKEVLSAITQIGVRLSVRIRF